MKKFFQYASILLMASVMGGLVTSCDNTESSDYDYIYDISSLKVGEENVAFGRKGGQQVVNVQSNQAVSVSSDADWAQVTAGTQSATLKSTPLTITASENLSGAIRTATIKVTAGSQSKEIKVTQSVDLVILKVEPSTVPGAGGVVNITLQSESDYDVIVSDDAQSWIEVQSTRALADHVVCLNVAGHIGPARSGNVTIRVTSTDGYTKIAETITINQEARETSIDTEATAMSIAKQMAPGWNLGNTLEGTSGTVGLGDETGWQETKTSQAIIDFVKAQGFRSVRIPCSWHRHMDASGTIDAAWLARVQEIVDYCISDGLYVVLNDHYDENWIENSMSSYDSDHASIMTNLWTQVATAFCNYDEHLLFAGLNEPAADSQEKTDNLVKYEQDFVNAVRATSGNNEYRTLIVQGPSTDIDNTSKYYNTLPTDVIADRLMVEVHYYSPWTFCGLNEDASWGKCNYFWGAANHVSGSAYNASSSYEEAYVQSQFKKMNTQFCAKGIPVLVGEYGCQWRELDANQAEHDASVKLFHKTVVSEAISNGMVPMVWDINSCDCQGSKGIMTIIDRRTPEVWCSVAMEGISEGAAVGVWPY